MVNNRREVQDIAAVDGVLGKIGLPDHRREELCRHEDPEVHNDVIHLLLPFLPLEGSTMTRYVFPAWKGTSGIDNVYCYWEGRISLQRKLAARIREEGMGWELREELRDVLRWMDELESGFGNDWYCRWSSGACIRHPNSWEQKLEAINECRRIFN